MRRAKEPNLARISDELNDFLLGSRLNKSLRPITESPAPVIEDTSANSSLKPEIMSERQSVHDDVKGGGKTYIQVSSVFHRSLLSECEDCSKLRTSDSD